MVDDSDKVDRRLNGDLIIRYLHYCFWFCGRAFWKSSSLSSSFMSNKLRPLTAIILSPSSVALLFDLFLPPLPLLLILLLFQFSLQVLLTTAAISSRSNAVHDHDHLNSFAIRHVANGYDKVRQKEKEELEVQKHDRVSTSTV